MGVKSFFKKVFGGEDEDEAELDAARARHGIKVDKKEMNKPMSEQDRMAANYDVWEDLENFRSNWIFGMWLNKKFHPIGEEKMKKELAELEKKKLAESEQAPGDQKSAAEREIVTLEAEEKRNKKKQR